MAAGIKRFQPILLSAKSRDLGESDTVRIVVDMLAEIFGYDKFSEITSEYAIRGTYCDLAIKIESALRTLIEVKSIGLELKEPHLKQAVDYAANEGVDWVVLTNALCWRIYKVTFTKPIDHELVIDIDFGSLNPKNSRDIDALYLFCKEGWVKSVLGDYLSHKQALSRFFLGAMLLTDPVLEVVRRELRHVSPDVKFDVEEIKAVLTAEVIKRDVMEGDKAEEARKRISKIARAASKALRKTAEKESTAVASRGAAESAPPASQIKPT